MPTTPLQLGVVQTAEPGGLYWATGLKGLVVADGNALSPRRWVADSDLFQEVQRDYSVDALVALHSRRAGFPAEPNLEKCVAEAIYEAARLEVLPAAPSRLACLFAALDGAAAIDFMTAYMPPPAFDATGFGNQGAAPVTADGGAWVALDMHLFSLSPISGDPRQVIGAVGEVWSRARQYWNGDPSQQPFVEVLCERLRIGGEPPTGNAAGDRRPGTPRR